MRESSSLGKEADDLSMTISDGCFADYPAALVKPVRLGCCGFRGAKNLVEEK